jgi:hypothetical protein
MSVSVGEEPAKMFRAQLHDPHICSIEHELFMLLSDLAAKRYGNCAIYQLELMDMIKAFLAGESVPPFPIELGTTWFGMTRPKRTKVFWARIRRPFAHAWLWWKLRHVRRENLLRYGKPAREKA